MSHFIPHFDDSAVDVIPWLAVCSGMLGLLLGCTYVLILMSREHQMTVRGENQVGYEIRQRRMNAEWNRSVREYCAVHGLAVPSVTISGSSCSESGA